MRQIEQTGSVRVDLAGGTLDLHPINLVLPKVATLNLATSLKARVFIKETREENVVIFSKDYNKTWTFESSQFTEDNLRAHLFEEMTFIAWILYSFNITSGIHLELSSGSPAGAGLGGSSAMGVTLFHALTKFKAGDLDSDEQKHEAVRAVNALEARILESGPAGYQDYYPALFGGVLALHPNGPHVRVEQLYSQELKDFLEDHLTLVYSGMARLSGINNWEVYKAFFDKSEKVRSGLSTIAKITWDVYEAILSQNYEQVLEGIAREGEAREALFPKIVPTDIHNLCQKLKNLGLITGMKMCGAGGGGCFLLVHPKGARDRLLPEIKEATMEVLKFEVEAPL